jgi:hypothetical protein
MIPKKFLHFEWVTLLQDKHTKHLGVEAIRKHGLIDLN